VTMILNNTQEVSQERL